MTISYTGNVNKILIFLNIQYTVTFIVSSVLAHIRGMYKDTAFEERDVEFVLGEGW